MIDCTPLLIEWTIELILLVMPWLCNRSMNTYSGFWKTHLTEVLETTQRISVAPLKYCWASINRKVTPFLTSGADWSTLLQIWHRHPFESHSAEAELVGREVAVPGVGQETSEEVDLRQGAPDPRWAPSQHIQVLFGNETLQKSSIITKATVGYRVV